VSTTAHDSLTAHRAIAPQSANRCEKCRLAPIYNRFTEGFETADLKTAKALIDGLYNTEGNSRSLLMDAPPKAAAFVELHPRTA